MLWIIIIAVIGYFVYKNFFEGQEKQKKPVRSNATQESALASSTPPKKEEYEPIREFNVNGVSFRMIRVDGGTFLMGATKEQGVSSKDAGPVHNVTLDTYMIGETQVTQELWEAVMGSNPSDNKNPQNPVENVSWDDCQEFIRKLNTLTGQTFCLPSEAEWEYAARGGNKSQHFKYSGSNNLDDVAWNWHNSGDEYLEGSDSELETDKDFVVKVFENHLQTHPVGQKLPNELGLFDMSGNVQEWCEDFLGPYFSVIQTNPKGAGSGSERVVRGGCYALQTFAILNSFRTAHTHDAVSSSTGFRLAISKRKDQIREYVVNGVSFRLVCVEGGYFQMGATDEQGNEPKGKEHMAMPVHGVRVNNFTIGETQVTQELWEAVMGSNPSYFIGENYNPVERVSWDDCQDFIRILNMQTGLSFRLPTEAEWEYAARGGKKSKHFKYSGSNNLDDVAWYICNSGDKRLEDSDEERDVESCRTHPVGLKLPNELGIFDMSGNVSEWCQDKFMLYNPNYQTYQTTSLHCMRGGDFGHQSHHCRVSSRQAVESQRWMILGFRLAL